MPTEINRKHKATGREPDVVCEMHSAHVQWSRAPYSALSPHCQYLPAETMPDVPRGRHCTAGWEIWRGRGYC